MSDANAASAITFKKPKSTKGRRKRIKTAHKEAEAEKTESALDVDVVEKIDVAKLEQRLRKRVRGLGASTFGEDGISIREKQGSQGDVSVEFTESTQVTQLDEAMEEYIQRQIEQARKTKNSEGEQEEEAQQRPVVDPGAKSQPAAGVRGWATATTRQHLVEEVDLGHSAKRVASEQTMQALELAEKEGRLEALEGRLGGELRDKQALSQWKNTFFKRN